jgi:hypothetical protein
MARFRPFVCFVLGVFCLAPAQLFAQHQHPVPERLGSVAFKTSCSSAVHQKFNRAVALLHSFAYQEAELEFRSVSASDPNCALAYWGIAMSYYHQLWEPPLSASEEQKGRAALKQALAIPRQADRESRFIAALAQLYSEAQPLRTRMLNYEAAMSEVAAKNPGDVESQIFYALALLSTAPPADKTHANQKKAVAILQPLYDRYPQHPGLAHYLIHACDNAEMANQGLKAARDYSKIAPSAPHALHMPSHIFTRLGMWNESVRSNLAAREAAKEHGDTGEELHAMDYLVYANLQLGHNDDVQNVLSDLRQKTGLQGEDFKVGYAATAMPVRSLMERGQWTQAAQLQSIANAPPQVQAITAWARAVGCARTGDQTCAQKEINALSALEQRLRADNRRYWADQVAIQISEARAWVALAAKNNAEAAKTMRQAADLEDAIEKLPLTPGPILPAREQLGSLLLEENDPVAALREFELSLAQSPGRRNSLAGALKAAQQSDNKDKIALYQSALNALPES